MSTVDIVDWNAISQQLDQLLELSPAQRQQRLQRLRGADPEMAAVLERLLAHETQAGQFLATPCWTPPCQVDGAGTRLGRYRLLRVLGEGGAGQVWLAERTDGRAPHQVALKRLHADLADAGARQRFERECDILARLQHPNLAQLLDAGVAEDGRPYLALSYIQGEPITGYCQHQQLSVTARLQLFMQLCAAVSHAHVNRVVHRDLKPANILVTAAGQVCVLDFGIAQLLGADAEPGGDGFTVHYAAPEQIDGAAITAQADVYSLGVVLHELLVGQKPYHLRRRRDLEDGVRLPLPTPPKPSLAVLHHAQAGRLDPATARRLARRLRGDVDSIVGKALCQAPEQRYASAEAMAQDLQRHLLHRPVQARPASFGYWLHGYLQRQRWGLALVILVLSGVSMTALWWAPLSLSRPQALHGFVIARFRAAGQASPPAPDIRPSRAAGERWEHRTLAVRPLLQAGNDGQRS